MRAIVFPEPGRFELTEVPDPVPGPREVVVEVAAVGLCGTDVHVFDGDFAPTEYPIIPGHETSAVVHTVGDEVTGLAPGDRVSVDPTLTCGECAYCAVGRGNLCEYWNGAGVGRTNGSTAELMLAPARNVHQLSDHVDLELAALIEPLSCAIHGFDLLPRRMGEHYLIYGAGTMGLMMAQLAPRAGAASVTIIDTNPRRLELAREVGITNTAASPAEAHSTSTNAVRSGGWDVVIDCTGVPSVIEDAIRQVRKGGTMQQFGVASTEAKASFSPFQVYNDEITIVGSMAVLNSYGRAVEMFAAGALNAQPMVSHAFSLDDYGDALEMFRTGAGRKLQIRPGLQESVVLI